jgi:hypothetical protein
MEGDFNGDHAEDLAVVTYDELDGGIGVGIAIYLNGCP